MTGVEIHIGLEDMGLEDALAAVVARASDLSEPMDEFGGYLVARTDRRFETESGPDGVPWDISERVWREGGQTLTDTAHLRASTTYQSGSDSVEVGSNLIYAAIQNLGGQAGRDKAVTIPARPFIDFDQDDEAEIKAILTDHLMGGLQ